MSAARRRRTKMSERPFPSPTHPGRPRAPRRIGDGACRTRPIIDALASCWSLGDVSPPTLGHVPSLRCQTSASRERGGEFRFTRTPKAPRPPHGGARRDRTDDLMLAKHALSQLSYGPILVSLGPSGFGSGAMVGLGRLERPTSPLSGVRSNHLSYKPETLRRGPRPPSRGVRERRETKTAASRPRRPDWPRVFQEPQDARAEAAVA